MPKTSKKLKMIEGSNNVFKNLGFSDAEAENLRLRADLRVRVEGFVEKSGLTQQQAAKVLGVTQPRLNQLLKGKIDKFSLDALVNMLAHAGMRVKLTVRKAA